MTKPKLCKDCRYLYAPCGVTAECRHPYKASIDLVTGLTRGTDASVARQDDMFLEQYVPQRICGPEGLLWESIATWEPKGDNDEQR